MITQFNQLMLEPSLQAALTAMNFETPTPIQAMAIPVALEGRDILGSAQTGTGKTAAFCVPMINYLIKNPTAHALVMLPTRELASQVHDVARKMIGQERGIKTALLIGGESIGKQYAQLDRRPRLIVGTPGRINDHLRGNRDLVSRVSFVVLDEADRMLDMGFAPQIDSILQETASPRQVLMFSATFPDNIVKFSKKYLNEPERISIGNQSKPGENIEQVPMFMGQEQKYDTLSEQLAARDGSIIIFVRTQHGADKLSAKLNKDQHTSEAIHGGLRQRQRDRVIDNFRKNRARILVATDVAARGLDVPHIEHVINYDLPQVAEDYIHRIGRTARAGAKGQAVSFIAPGERHLWRDIERLLNPGQPGSDIREGGRGGSSNKKRSGGGGGYGSGKSFGKKPFRKKYEDRNNEGGQGGDRAASRWNPDGDFKRSEGGSDRPAFKKTFKKREDGGQQDFARDPEAYKKTRFEGEQRKEGGFKKPFRRDDTRSDRPRSAEGRPLRKDGDRSENRGNTNNAGGGGFKKPYAPKGDAPRRSEGGRFEGRGEGTRSASGSRARRSY